MRPLERAVSRVAERPRTGSLPVLLLALFTIVRREEAGDLSLDAPESGDLILLAMPGFALSMRTTAGVVSGPADEYGGHGYRAVYRDFDASFLAAGPGVPRGRAAEIGSQTIAVRVAAALGIERPRQAAPAR